MEEIQQVAGFERCVTVLKLKCIATMVACTVRMYHVLHVHRFARLPGHPDLH